MAAAGLRDAAPGASYAPVPLERLVADPPDGFVPGFFEPGLVEAQRWSMGRPGVLKRLMRGRVIARLPASILGCPAWFAADGARDLAMARGAR